MDGVLTPTMQAALAAGYVVSVGAFVLELLLLRVVGAPVDRRGERTSLLSGGLAFGGLAVANRLFFTGLMVAIWALRPWDLGSGPLVWLLAFVVYDLCFYIMHRLGHEVRLVWCFHSVHHTSEQMQLTTAIRGSFLDFVYAPWFFVWIPLLGIHPGIVLVVEAVSRVWGVLQHVHPRFVGRLGVLDRLMITPSVHRVHHGRAEIDLDRNYGQVLLVWDHLFGTYQPETAPPDYGVLSPVDAGSLVDVQLSPWRALWRDLRRAPDLGSRLRYLFDAPGWSHDGPDARVRARRRQG